MQIYLLSQENSYKTNEINSLNQDLGRIDWVNYLKEKIRLEIGEREIYFKNLENERSKSL